jgi:hypothetical protein
MTTMPLTADRLRPNPAISSFPTRKGAASSKLTATWMVTRGPARHACLDDGGQTELPDHPQRFAVDAGSATFGGHTDTAEVVHGLANSRAYGGAGQRRTPSGRSEADGELLVPVFVRHVGHCYRSMRAMMLKPSGHQATDFPKATVGPWRRVAGLAPRLSTWFGCPRGAGSWQNPGTMSVPVRPPPTRYPWRTVPRAVGVVALLLVVATHVPSPSAGDG